MEIRMLCDICNKKKAKIYYTEIINGEKHEQHLCEDCAAAGYASFLGKEKSGEGLSLGSMLSGILGSYAKGLQEKRENERTCPSCGMTEQEFLKKGRFGCAACYDAFSEVLGNNLRVMQGADMHFGKRPVCAEGISNTKKVALEKAEREQTIKDIEGEAVAKKKARAKKKVEADTSEKAMPSVTEQQLRIRLSEAIAVEDYEEAARIRDEIKALKK